MTNTKAIAGAVGGAAAAAVAGTAYYRRFMARRQVAADVLNSTLPVHSKWWRERFTQQGALSYVALGDSAAQGIGASAPSRSYVGRIGQHIKRTTRSTVGVKNLAVSGSTTRLCKINQVPRLADLTPDIVTVAIGSNDVGEFNAAKFEKNIRAIYGALPSHAIVADLPFMLLPDLEKKVAVANEIVRRVAGELGLTVAPLYATTRRQGYIGTYRNTAKDLFHPNDKGYTVWASAFFPAIDARLARIAAERAAADVTASRRVTSVASAVADRAHGAAIARSDDDVTATS
ncbi:SGNH/GDSL hydrolase family protein [Frondihabitans sp. VKM Ac-2883]|uniref:SGNH/GDSL hydrolase family protein n=1 Tax=Frondihabitans sp. VKM Ac-2883 TaxID=2783823 RepID=UPI00188C5587|nr:SGNH/GDSL hydrolase family protein [Frondihabitans sp. VKM Ac-2883]MBF4575061.1 SGNH/GDSL hydrolase family protein [Frondihabitans sp. VKM Ac-2883]